MKLKLGIFFLFFFKIGVNSQTNINYIRNQFDSTNIKLNKIDSFKKSKITNSLKISDEFTGNCSVNNWYEFRNLSSVQLGLKFNKLPILLNMGVESGRNYEKNFNQLIFNFKIDVNSFIENQKKDLDLNRTLEHLDEKIDQNILKEEIKKNVNKELKNKLTSEELDTIFSKIESMKEFEGKIKDIKNVQVIKQQKILLKEYRQGNIINNINYDSIIQSQNKFDKEYEQYRSYQKDSNITKFRKKLEYVLENKEKAIEIKNKAQNKINNLRNNYGILEKFKLTELKLSKLNIGQTSIDNSELVFRSFMINGINIEVKSPFYFNFIYSLPFQTNFFSNYNLSSIQNKQVSTLGGSLGIHPDKKINTQIGYYIFNEKNGSSILEGSQKNIDKKNTLLTMSMALNLNENFKSKLEIAKSEVSSSLNQNIINSENLNSNMALLFRNELELFNKKTNIKVDVQRVGLNYYSSANLFIQKGTGGLVSLNQKIGSRLTLKSKLSYRFSEDSNKNNSNLATYANLRYKINKNTLIELRGNYFQNQIEFKDVFSYTKTELYNISWMQKIKIKKSQHIFNSTAQYSKNETISSIELNNSGINRNILLNSNYNTILKKITLNAMIEDNYNIDSSVHIFSNSFNCSFPISEKTILGFGFNSRIKSSYMEQYGVNFNFSTKFKKIFLTGNFNYINDKMLNSYILGQLRMEYNIY